MINKSTQMRELCYIVKINEIRPIPGKDRVECAVVNGWTIMVRKDQFKAGDLGIYFEIDSKVPETEPFEFLSTKHYKIKTQKYKTEAEPFYSQGLLMSAEDFGWEFTTTGQFAGDIPIIKTPDNKTYIEGDFLTEKLGVTYAVEEDNKRKAKINPDAKINAALQRHPKIAKKFGKFIKKNKLARWIFLVFFGRKAIPDWPQEVKKTDEERIENRPWTLEAKNVKWVATEKIDGTSTTFHLRRAKGLKKEEYFVCSRNVVFDTPNKACYYDTNVYLEMSEKYNMREVLHKLLENRPTADWVTVQAETFGANIQKRDYGMKDHDLRAFNLIYSDCGRVGTIAMKEILAEVGVPCVPILEESYILPDTIDELREFVHSQKSEIDGGMREGIVFRAQDGSDSFKCVDPEFLVKFHQ